MNNPLENLNSIFKSLRKYSGSCFVIQCDGKILQDNSLLKSFAEDLASLQSAGIDIIVIHEGNSIVEAMLEKFDLKNSNYVNVDMVEMILSGYVNQKIVTQINQLGGMAVGISGKDGQFLTARRSKIARLDYSANDKVLNFGFQGELSTINPEILFALEERNLMPVISPITVGDDGRSYKIDAHDISAALATVTNASKLIFISDLAGVENQDEQTICELDTVHATKLLSELNEKDSLAGKLRSCLMALEHMTEAAYIIDGKIPHALMLQLFTDTPVGTTIKTIE